MDKEQIKNRNRVVTLLDNCAKVLSVKKDADVDVKNLVIRIRQLAGNLRNNTICEKTIENLYSKFDLMFEMLNTFKNKGDVNLDAITHMQSIVEKGLSDYKDETLRKAVAMNTPEYFDNEISKIEQELISSELDLQKLTDEGKEETTDYKRLQRKIIALKGNIMAMKDMAKAKRESDDMEKALGNRMKPLSVDIENATIEIKEERGRLERLYKTYYAGICSIVVAMIIWETFLVCKLYPQLTLHEWVNYMPFYLPIPLFAGMLWMCVYQINRAQRQMVELANRLYRLKHSDSLLKTSVSLYADMRKNEEHVSKLIDSMIEQNKAKEMEEDISTKPIDYSIPLDKIIEIVKAITHK